MPKAKKTPTKAMPNAKGAHPVSPLAPTRLPKRLPPVAGVSLATGAAGIKYRNRTDVLMVLMDEGTQAAGVFTKSKTASAPVEWCKAHVKKGAARTLVVNSGNANAFTGHAGLNGVETVMKAAASIAGCKRHEAFMASTGVIGEPLPAEKITRVLGTLARTANPNEWRAAAEAIMTTDTFPKLASAKAKIGGQTVTINGIAKGSGMIAPDMATMLSYVFTDAKLPAAVLRELLSAGVKPSFNSITVDSDTSTSDTLMLFATGKVTHPKITKASDKRLDDFRKKLNALLLELALLVVKDGEGASKLIRIDVMGAVSDDSAKIVGLSIANSPLVKTAMAGGDANWGRVVMAVGKAGEPANRDRLKISFGNQIVAEKGLRSPRYNEAAATKMVRGRNVQIGVDLGLGRGRARVWTCDLTEGYIRINGSYRS